MAHEDLWKRHQEYMALLWFRDYWKGLREIAELAEETPPKTVAEVFEHMDRLAEGQEED